MGEKAPMFHKTKYHSVKINDDDYNFTATKQSCFKRKCGEKIIVWQLLATIFVFITAIVLVLVFEVVPVIVQRVVNNAEINFTAISMQNLTRSSFTIYANGQITHSGPISATITPSNTFNIFYKDALLGYMDIPVISVKGGASETPLLINNSVVTIINTTVFTQYGNDLLDTAQANWDLRGHVDVTAYGITLHKFNFIKTIAIGGMIGLSNTTVSSFDLPGDSPGQLDLVINAIIDNPSFVGMHIGDIHFDIIYENWTIGNLIAPNVILLPGTNLMSMTGFIKPSNNESLPSISVFFSKYISGVDSVVSVRGTGGSLASPPWLSSILKTLDIATVIVGAKDLNLIFDLALGQLSMALPGTAGQQGDSGVVTLSSSVQSGFKSPFPITLDVYKVSITADMSIHGQVLASIPPTPAFSSTSDQSQQRLSFNLSEVGLQIVDRVAFTNLVSELVLSPGSEFNLSGVATAMVRTQIGEMVLTNISFRNQPIQLNGFDSFSGNLIQVQEPNTHITNGYPWGLELYLNVAIQNPSSIAIQLDSLSFDLYYKGTNIGNASLIGGVALGLGVNYVTCYANYVKPEDADLEREFMSKYLQGNDSIVSMVGNANNIPLMIPAMQHLNITITFPGQKESLLAWATIAAIFPPSSALALFNPIDCNISVLSFTGFNIYKPDWEYFTTLYDTTFEPALPIASHEIHVTENIRLEITWDEFLSIFEGYMSGNHTLITVGQMLYQVGDFGPITVDIQQNFTLVGSY